MKKNAIVREKSVHLQFNWIIDESTITVFLYRSF